MSSLQKIWSLIGQQNKVKLVFVIFMMMIAMLLEVFSIATVIPIVTLILNPQSINQKFVSNEFLDNFLLMSTTSLIMYAMAILIIIFFIKNIFILFMQWHLSRYIFRIQEEISVRLYNNYLQREYSFFLKKNSAELIRNIITEITQFTNGALLPLLVLLSEIFVLIGIVSLILYISLTSAFLSFLVFFSIFILYYFFVRNYLLNIGLKRIKKEEKRMKILNQGFGSIKEIKIYKKEGYFKSEFAKLTKFISFAAQQNYFLQSIPRLLFELLAIITLFIVVYVLLFIENNIENLIPILGLYAASAFRLIPSMNKITNSLQSVRYAFASIQVLYDDLNDEKTKVYKKNIKLKATTEINRWDTIYFENVSYKYPKTEKNIIKNINIQIKRGSVVGIIGETGSGKSTIVNLISLLLKPSMGEIKINDFIINANDFENQNVKDAWQSRIGYVPQQVYLNDDSIANNIAFGNSEENISLERVNEVLRQCQLDDLIKDLPNGINTKVGERGIRVSGGQLQRIGIARALYHDPDILILDEATSALDAETEKKFIESLYSIRMNKTLLIISHKPSILDDCDVVFKLKNQSLYEVDLKNEE